MAYSSSNNFENFDTMLDEKFDKVYDQAFDHIVAAHADRQQARKPRKKRVYIERDHEDGHIRLWTDYFSEDAIYFPPLFRRRFRMNKALFIRITDRLSNEILFFQRRRDATGRFGLSAIQKCTAAIRMMAYGCAADAVDEYLRLSETTTMQCLVNFVEGVINLFGDEYLRRPTQEDLQRLLDIGELRGFPGMIGSTDCTLNVINVLDRFPVFDDILQGHAPKVNYIVNGREYHLAYYLSDGIYSKWATFIQSIRIPQDPKASLFATCQETVRKDVEHAFGVLQARFAIVKNPALVHDKEKIGKIMRGCIILHNIIVEDERDGYTLLDPTEFAQVEALRTSHVDSTVSTDTPSNVSNMMTMLSKRKEIRNQQKHQQLKDDLVENI
ncbi:PREDICTED: uncharacterized protein LOC104728263 [Camelina sativa]|uniref:Uncharacterized protein LOC104728263 n=1 Tax=Camelina sativa TaxID=90675 RepID=A0ABM1QL32_CAMSA|nr:PREDICTED: uncharacterized protein LOC104728263 [Camelina sativa]